MPQFRLKSDAVPGLTTTIRVTPDREGNFEVVCTELCGIGHSTMRQFARVVPASEFRSWVVAQKKAASGGAAAGGGGGGGQAAGAGRRAALHLERLLGLPHAGEGRRHGEGRAGPRQAGPRERRFIRTSIVDPNADITKGYKPNIMPQDFKDKLSKDELDALVKYLLEAQG